MFGKPREQYIHHKQNYDGKFDNVREKNSLNLINMRFKISWNIIRDMVVVLHINLNLRIIMLINKYIFM